MTREERKEAADMRDEYHAMEERVAALEEERDKLLEALEKIKRLYVSPIGDIACQMREIATEALQEAEG